MPLTEKGKKIKGAMTEEYGKKQGEKIFYASANKGTITGVHGDEECMDAENEKLLGLHGGGVYGMGQNWGPSQKVIDGSSYHRKKAMNMEDF